jgi:hypothetical protein
MVLERRNKHDQLEYRLSIADVQAHTRAGTSARLGELGFPLGFAVLTGLVGGLLGRLFDVYGPESLAILFGAPPFWFTLSWMCGTRSRTIGLAIGTAVLFIASSIVSYYTYEGFRIHGTLAEQSSLALPWLLVSAPTGLIAGSAGYLARSKRWVAPICHGLPLASVVPMVYIILTKHPETNLIIASVLLVSIGLAAVAMIPWQRYPYQLIVAIFICTLGFYFGVGQLVGPVPLRI